ncbi:hypothetical protein Misp01_32030 [Microtetraspora sp. NBRC 13810]|uniref:hypothetical protein n=1 Tax=Microtetraspora sp. NBRC 13810 TaxID=3030990 RepID=UPI0024A18F4F|nr:hypothetical protein [Microtetraspora sp. NBRC 13810]GLW08073.1 hypothetical protein Misp01_32030 [Microtetraspora sp. NBRC 13810]
MFEGLDHVPWAGLGYAHSGKADMPSLFRALLVEEEAFDAADELLNELYHQGGFVCSAAVAAMPYLLEAAESPLAGCRCEVLEIVGRLALTAREVGPRGVAHGWTEAWTAAVPRLLALLDDDDPRVRRAAALTLAEAVAQADEVVGALRGGWAAQDRVTRLDLVLVAGSLAGSLTAAVLPETLAWLRDLTRDPDEQVRLAATLALAEALPGRPVALEPVVTALSGDVTAWSGSEHASGTPRGTVWWAIDRLGDDVDAREEVCLTLLAHPVPGHRQGAVRAAADLLSVSRRPRRLLPALREATADPDPETRVYALHLLAAHTLHGEPAGIPADGRDADLFAGRLDDRAEVRAAPVAADVAVWGLAWSGDGRALPGLAGWIGGERAGTPLVSAHGGKHTYPTWLPSLAGILAPCSAWAGELLPVILPRLHPGVRPDLGGALLRTLEAWGPAAAPAASRVAGLLGGELRHQAAETLGAIGPAAASAGPALRDLLEDPGAGLAPWARRRAAVAVPWAWWRVTGDPEPALRAFGPRLGEEHAVSRRLADLGAHASRHVPVLRLLAGALDPWTAVEAAHALVRITGDAAEGTHVLIRPVRDLLDGTARPVVRTCVRHLAGIEDLLPGHLVTMEEVLEDDRRHSWDGGWAAIHDDLEIRATLRATVGRSRP